MLGTTVFVMTLQEDSVSCDRLLRVAVLLQTVHLKADHRSSPDLVLDTLYTFAFFNYRYDFCRLDFESLTTYWTSHHYEQLQCHQTYNYMLKHSGSVTRIDPRPVRASGWHCLMMTTVDQQLLLISMVSLFGYPHREICNILTSPLEHWCPN